MNKNNNDSCNRKLAFKNNAPFTACISKINEILVDNAKDLYVVMPMYNFFEYSKNYEKEKEVSGIIIDINQKMVHQVMEMRK